MKAVIASVAGMLRMWWSYAWLRMDYSLCMAEAYLAERRGEMVIAADWSCRAMDVQRQLDHLRPGMRCGRCGHVR